MLYLIKLMEIMNVKHSISILFGNNKKYYFVVEGEDKTRNEFLNKFIDNGHKLMREQLNGLREIKIMKIN